MPIVPVSWRQRQGLCHKFEDREHGLHSRHQVIQYHAECPEIKQRTTITNRKDLCDVIDLQPTTALHTREAESTIKARVGLDPVIKK
jgi:hypothetical protein